MAAPAHHFQHLRHIERRHPATSSDEDALLHLDEQREGVAVGHVHGLVHDEAHALDVLVPGKRRDQHVEAAGFDRPGTLEHAQQQVTLRRAQGVVQEPFDHLLVGALPHAEGERLDVAHRGRRKGERPGVLVDPQREDRGLEWRHLELALGDDAQHEGDQRAVVGGDHVGRVDERRQVARRAMVVEDEDLDVGPFDEHAELAEPVRVIGLDEHEPPHLRQVDGAGVGQRDLIGEQGPKLTHVAVDGAAQDHARLGIELVRRDHRGEAVEVGVGVGRDQLDGAHGKATIPPGSRLQ